MKKVIALAGNPNVGKSTVFNALTGMNQHTGNWPGKTVGSARGFCRRGDMVWEWVDLPGCYSLMAHSEEEEIARDFICFGHPDAVVIVCDAACLERNLNLALQILEITDRAVLCVNLLDEAEKNRIRVDLPELSRKLGIPAVGTAARSGKGLEGILEGLKELSRTENHPPAVQYPPEIQEAFSILEPALKKIWPEEKNLNWMCGKLLAGSQSFLDALERHLGISLSEEPEVSEALKQAKICLREKGISQEEIENRMAEVYVRRAEEICNKTVIFENQQYLRKDRRLDWLFTSRKTGFLMMFLMLTLIFWITVSGANIPSELLAEGLFWIQDRMADLAAAAQIPPWIREPLIFGVYRVLAWVVSVMLPPMAIFFPLFTLLEDFGYLPRVAFNLDRCFQKCCACGKQALTMCMGFGCNAAGITGCRIIDSPRERLIAVLTNSFVPCNGRFPAMISVISMFLVGSAAGLPASLLSALILAAVILFGIAVTLIVSRILSGTVLKGMPSSFALELPPYRRPQIGKVIVRSVLDRTVYVLGRAAAVAAPAGLLIWLAANITIGGYSLFSCCAGFLDPFARLLGMDGVILLAFILGMPANELVLPIVLMGYLAQGSLTEMGNLAAVQNLLVQNGWTWMTAVSVILFSLMHWPCGTACITVYRETKSIKWTAAAVLIPTAAGMTVCFLFTAAARFLTGLL